MDDILLRRSNSLRFGLEAKRKINSFEELGVTPNAGMFNSGSSGSERRNSVKMALNGSAIGLEVSVFYMLFFFLRSSLQLSCETDAANDHKLFLEDRITIIVK